ncbi:MAG TPA: DUF2510 domain-containing protein [Propionicimonas sp.]|nr:DUF2510 domain-containing protein [Propionicimonas sp.]HQA76971.1 DUF2510 domain-containing protein [Propionicimonas sp.]HQD97108.1 DUF2510 domain-containing protein [Propionicimonas sp.]
MSNAGWYPDPGGQPGMYRYWTGTEWTSAITANPAGTQPPSYSSGQPAGVPGQGRKRGATGWWLGGLAALAAVVVAIWFVAQSFGTTGGILGGDDPTTPGGGATQLICPPGDNSTASAPPAGEPGWTTGGRLSFPTLGDPWTTGHDYEVPYGSVATVQTVLDQDNYDGRGNSWVASVLVSDLYVGDGFASPKQGAEIVLKCVLGKYYADTIVTQNPISSAKHDVDGHSGWLIETDLSFSISNLNATSERVLLLVVQTGTEEYGLFYASVPNTLDHLMPDARQALANLRVEA